MFGYSLIRTRKLMSIYEKIAIFVGKIIRLKRLQMEIKGRVIYNLGIQSGTSKAGNAWSKASIVIETEGQYPKKVLIENIKKAEEFSKIAVGSIGTFDIEISSNEFNGRWYTSVNCWRWKIEQNESPVVIPAPAIPPAPQPVKVEDDDLPF